MPIWLYDDTVRDQRLISRALEMTKCVFCKSDMDVPIDQGSVSPGGSHDLNYNEIELLVFCCPTCGWWTAQREYGTELRRFRSGACGSLRELDFTDQSTPIEEIRAYLLAKYDARFHIDPLKFEEVVASVYRGLGYQARVTARSGDGGVDIVLDGPSGQTIGVQIKGYKARIEVEQIRAFTGALLLSGLNRGIFVTTSSFRSGALKVTELARLRGTPIELVDGKRFYDAMGIIQRRTYEPAFGRTALYYQRKLLILEADEGDPFGESNLINLKPGSRSDTSSDGARMVRLRELLAPDSRRRLDEEF